MRYRKQAGGREVFDDATEMKEKARKAIQKAEYSVHDLYHTEGICQAIARDVRFEGLVLAVIAVNAVWIAIDADFNDAAALYMAHPVFQVMDHFFCAFFLVEWGIRFGAFRVKAKSIRDRDFLVDTVLMLFMVGDTWVLTIIIFLVVGSIPSGVQIYSVLRLVRLVRLTRMGRMMRLLRAFPELMVLIKGVVTAVRSVSFTLCLLAVVIYIFAVSLRQLTDGTELGKRFFSNVPHSAFSLLIDGTIPDLSMIVSAAMDEHLLYAFFLMVYIALAFLTIMNMIVGVIVEVVSVVATVENEEMAVKFVRNRLLTVFKSFIEAHDEEAARAFDESFQISQEEFMQHMSKPEAVRAIQEVGVDVVGLIDLADLIFMDGPILFGHFMEAVLQLRGSNQATVKDIVDLRKVIMQEIDHIDVERIFSILSSVQAEVRKMRMDMDKARERTCSTCAVAGTLSASAPVARPLVDIVRVGGQQQGQGGFVDEAAEKTVEFDFLGPSKDAEMPGVVPGAAPQRDASGGRAPPAVGSSELGEDAPSPIRVSPSLSKESPEPRQEVRGPSHGSPETPRQPPAPPMDPEGTRARTGRRLPCTPPAASEFEDLRFFRLQPLK